jgi:hypothetical protein
VGKILVLLACVQLTACNQRHADSAVARFSSVLSIKGSPHRACSAVRVSETLVLTAAHCVLGLNADEPVEHFTAVADGRERALEPIELGDFEPSQAKLIDFAILTGADLPPSVEVARLATPEEIRAAENVGDSLLDRSIEVWVAGYSMTAARTPPRDPIPGNALFASQGWLKSRSAYRWATFLALKHDFVVDDRFGPPPPDVASPSDAEWQGLSGIPTHDRFEQYTAAGALIFYHSADYAPGGSGGGAFLSNGHLLGIIPLGASPGSRNKSYRGFGQALRVDVICRHSKALGGSSVCAGFK